MTTVQCFCMYCVGVNEHASKNCGHDNPALLHKLFDTLCSQLKSAEQPYDGKQQQKQPGQLNPPLSSTSSKC